MKRNLRKVLFLMLCLFTLLSITACGKPSEERVRKKMEQHLYEKYGEEFVVDTIGTRSANNQKFYQARIYPKSIIGTEREDDSYYYASSSINIDSWGRLSKGVGDSYWEIKMNDDAENYLLPKVKELFGERIRLKTSVKYQERIENSQYFAWYKRSDFKEALNNAREDQENRVRLELTLYLYLFDRIDNEREKEERKNQIFEFIQYLKGEGLFEYLEMYVVFTDEIFLSSSFEKYEWSLDKSEEEEDKIEKKLRKNMNKIKKSDLGIESNERLYRFNQSRFLVLAMEKLKMDKYGRYDRAKETSTVEKHNYIEKEDIEFLRYEHYIFK